MKGVYVHFFWDSGNNFEGPREKQLEATFNFFCFIKNVFQTLCEH